MGIPHLTTHLTPYSIPTTLSCSIPHCPIHTPTPNPPLIIDGPSFAYFIYDRLIRSSPDYLDALGAVPSYREVGDAAVWFLGKVEGCGGVIQKIYFDGFLPPGKHETRIKRLNNQISRLSSTHSSHQRGFQNLSHHPQNNSHPSPKILEPSISHSPSHSLPALPFFVAAIIEALKGSRYADITSVVPGEADAYCAEEVRRCEGAVLTNDSDLVVYDLGSQGAVGLLHALAVGGEDESGRGHRVVQTSVIKPRDVAKSLGLVDLQQLAWALAVEDSSLQQAVKRAKSSGLDSAERDKFLDEYTSEPSVMESRRCLPSTVDRIRTQALVLDPRISEFVLQSHTASPCMYLPIMIEDPTRTSAFAVSTHSRILAYSCCILVYETRSKDVIEYDRKGQKVMPTTMTTLSKDDLFRSVRKFHTNLQRFRHTFSAVPAALVWRIHALAEVYHWYIDTSRTPPQRGQMSTVLSGKTAGGISWSDIHLTAQIEATLYSMRMMKQILAFAMPTILENNLAGSDLSKEVKDLDEDLEDLPLLANLMPSRSELVDQVAGVDLDELLNLLAAILQDDVGQISEADADGDGDVGDSHARISTKKRKRRKRPKTS